MKRARSENNRYLSWQKQSSSQQGVVWQHWRALRRLLTSERGAWANRYENKPKGNWPKIHIQINSRENFVLPVASKICITLCCTTERLHCPFSVCSSQNLLNWIFSFTLFNDRVQPEVKWKLSNAETYSKMRLKLVPNYNYDSHSEASALRDNMGKSQRTSMQTLLFSFCCLNRIVLWRWGHM